jgi:hypothetical protein
MIYVDFCCHFIMLKLTHVSSQNNQYWISVTLYLIDEVNFNVLKRCRQYVCVDIHHFHHLLHYSLFYFILFYYFYGAILVSYRKNLVVLGDVSCSSAGRETVTSSFICHCTHCIIQNIEPDHGHIQFYQLFISQKSVCKH